VILDVSEFDSGNEQWFLSVLKTTNYPAVPKIIGTPGSLLLAEWQKSRRPDQPLRFPDSVSLIQCVRTPQPI
jgi:hypothetical protein